MSDSIDVMQMLDNPADFPFIVIPDVRDENHLWSGIKIPFCKKKGDPVHYLLYTLISMEQEMNIHLQYTSPTDPDKTNGLTLTHNYEDISRYYKDVDAAIIATHEVIKRIQNKKTEKTIKEFVDFYDANFVEPIVIDDLYEEWKKKNSSQSVTLNP